MFNLFIILAVLVSSSLLTGICRHYLLKKEIVDIPNHRSSHTKPVPRGGGLGLVLPFLLSLLALRLTGYLTPEDFLALFFGGALVTAVGFLDDYRPVRAGWRLLVHLGAAAWGLYWLGGFPEIVVAKTIIIPQWAGNLLGLIVLAWFVNLFNFMDGIDGITATEAIFISGSAALLIRISGNGGDVLLLILFACACLGFLFWNWPPARIFMGDTGSGFIGLTLGLLMVKTANSGDLSLWTWLILAGAFIVDATLTLLRRMFTGLHWYRPHRSHCYQILAGRWNSHKRVTAGLIILNLGWLLPLALLSICFPVYVHLLVLIAWFPLICFVWLVNRIYS